MSIAMKMSGEAAGNERLDLAFEASFACVNGYSCRRDLR